MLKASPKIAGLVSNSTRTIVTSTNRFVDQKWRENQGLTANPNSFGPLTNLPDFTFLDGRPTPVGSNMQRRLMKQREAAAKIVTMCKELKFAKERFAKIQDDKVTKEKEDSERRFKPKGHLLLKLK